MNLSFLKDIKQSLNANPFYAAHRHLVIPGVVLIIALLISALVTIPQLLRLFETFKTIDELNQQKSFFQTKNQTLQAIDVDLYKKNLEVALRALPVDKDITGVTGELLTALSSSSMTLNGINFSASPAESEKLQEYSIVLDISGSQSSLLDFLDRVKLSPRIIKMTTLELSRSRADVVTASVNFVTIYQQLPTNIGSVDAPVPVLSETDKKALAEIEDKVGPITTTSGGSSALTVPGKLNPFAP